MKQGKVVLVVKGLGHVPSFKNSKMITRNNVGRPRLITDPEKQKWMERCIRSFESQLLSWFRTTGAGMQTAPYQLFSISWLDQFDDSVQWIASEHVEVVRVPKGEEGAIVTIEQL